MTLRRLFVLVLAMALLAAACSRDDKTSTEGGGTTAPAATGTTAPGAEAGLAEGAFGDLGTVCSEGETPAEPVTGQTGVNGTTIKVATFSDRGFSGRPGLTREFHDIAEAVTKWCNEHGGVRGYTVEADLRDSALTNYPPLVVQSCDEDFFMVAGGAVFDNQGVPEQLKCGLPNIAGYVVTGESAGADLTVQPIPNPVQKLPYGDLKWLEAEFPGTTENVGIMTGDIATTVLVADRYQEAAKQLGWNVVDYQKYSPLGESNWTPFVQRMKDKGVKGLLWVGEPENLAKMMQAAANIDYVPEWVRTDANHYDTNLTKVGGAAVDNVYVRNAFWPFERAEENTATQQYLDLLDQYGPGDGRVALLGLQGLSAWMMFFTALGECADAGTVTRDCVYEKAASLEDWTGGGLHVPTNQGVAPDCFSIAKGGADGFTFPDVTEFGASTDADFFACDPKEFVTTLTGDYGQGAKCPSGKPDPLPSECNP